MNDRATRETVWTRILLGPAYAKVLYASACVLLVAAIVDIFGRAFGIDAPRGFAAPSVLFCAVLFATRILAGQQQISREVLPADKLETMAIKNYPIWEKFYGTYYAINAPWELETSCFRGGTQADRRRFKEYLSTHVRRYCGVHYVNGPTVATARYIFTTGSEKRHDRQLDNFAQFMSALRTHAGQAKWSTIANRVRVVEIKSPFVSTVFSGHRVDEVGQSVAQSIIYIDAPGFSRPGGVPRTVLMTHSESVFQNIESWYEDHPDREERSIEEWLDIHSKRANVEPPIPYRAPSVFLSYTRMDEQIFESVHLFLEQNGLNPWFDREIRTGDDWKEKIRARLRDADCGVLLHSKASAQRALVAYERDILADAGKLIVIRLDETPLPIAIEHLQYDISFRGWKGDPSAQCARRLQEDIERFVYPLAAHAPQI